MFTCADSQQELPAGWRLLNLLCGLLHLVCFSCFKPAGRSKAGMHFTPLFLAMELILFVLDYAECVIDKSVNCSPTQVACRNHMRRVPEDGGKGVAGTKSTNPCSNCKKYDRIIDGALFLLQHKISYRLCHSLPNDVLCSVCLLFWIHTKFHTMLT